MLHTHLLSVILATPLAGALIVLAIDGTRARMIRWTTLVVAVMSLLLSIPLWLRYDPAGVTWQFTERAAPVPSIGAAYALGVDGFSIALILLVTLVAAFAAVSLWTPIGTRTKESCVLLLVLEASMLGALMSLDLLLFFICWNVMLAAIWFLARTGDEGRTRPRRIVSMHILVASGALLAGILLLYAYVHSATGLYTFDLARLLDLPIPPAVQRRIFAAWLVAFGVLVPVFPFQRWLPAAVERAPAGIPLLLTAGIVKIGAYGLIRFSLPLAPDAARTFAPLVASIAMIGIIYGIAAAYRQTEWTRVIAYLTAAYMGVAMVSLFRLTPSGLAAGILQQIDHGLVVAACFLIAGVASARQRAGDGVLSPARPAARRVFAFLVLALAMMGAVSIGAARSARPAQFTRRIETSVGRVIARVNPALAPLVKQPSDCGAPASPIAPSSSAPAGWITAVPCADGAKPPPPPDRRR